MKKVSKNITIDELAIMIANGFKETHGKIAAIDHKVDNLENRFDNLDHKVDDGFLIVNNRFNNVNVRLDVIEREIKEISKNLVTREEFENLMTRVEYIEMKLGIKMAK